MAIVRFLLGLLAAIFCWSLALQFHPGASRFFDPFLILVLYHSLRSPPLGGAGGGTVVGLMHDALSGGLYGLHGFADTLTGYLAGVVRQHVVIQQPLQVALLCLLGGAGQALVLTLLQLTIVGGGDLPQASDVAIKALVTGVLGMGVFLGSNRFFSWERGWRDRRRRRLGLDTDD